MDRSREERGPEDKWRIVAYVTGSSIETRTANNSIEHRFDLNLPNLTFVDPVIINSRSTPEFLPNTGVFVSAVVRNDGLVQTEPEAFLMLLLYLGTGPVTLSIPNRLSCRILLMDPLRRLTPDQLSR